MFSITFWLILLGAFLLLVLFLDHLLKDNEFDKIQGPKGIFLLGNCLDFMTDPLANYRIFRVLAKTYSNSFKFRLLSWKFICIYSPEDAEVLLSGFTCAKKGKSYEFLQPWLNDGLLLSNGTKWQQRRKILTPAFHFNMLRHYSSNVAKRCTKLIEQLEAETIKSKTAAHIYTDDFTLNTICETTMGVSLDEELNDFGSKYKNAIHNLISILHKRITRFWLYPDITFKNSTLGHKMKAQLHLLHSFRDRVIQARRKNPLRLITNNISDVNEKLFKTTNDMSMLDILLKASDDGIIDNEGICEELDTFIFEGHDTTSTSLQFTFMLLANHQDVQDKIVTELKQICGSSDRALTTSDLAEMKYLECCIKESLRLYPPVYYIVRQIEEPIQLKDYVCPAGVEIILAIIDLQRRADQFPEPLKFKPERFMTEPTWHRFAYVPFSAGPRNCIGQKFAMMEMKLVISSVLQKYRLLPITKPDDIEIVGDIVLRPKDPIYVKFEKR